VKNSRLHLIGTFDTYQTDDIPNAKNPKSELLQLLNKPEKWAFEIVIIQSTSGNGSTHLLHAVLAEIENQGRNATFTYSQRLLQAQEFYCTEKGRFVHDARIQVKTEFFLIDGCHYCEAKPVYYDYFVGILKSSIKRDVKIILSARTGSFKQLIQDFPNYHVVTSEFPTALPLYNIIDILFTSHQEYWKDFLLTEEMQVRAVCAFANQSYNSVRLLETMVLTFLASLYLGKIKLQDDNIEPVIKEYVNTFIIKYG
jgi:hypothetical protein